MRLSMEKNQRLIYYGNNGVIFIFVNKSDNNLELKNYCNKKVVVLLRFLVN